MANLVFIENESKIHWGTPTIFFRFYCVLVIITCIITDIAAQKKIIKEIQEEVQQKPCSCMLSQGSFSTPIELFTGTQTPVAFYNYIGSSAATGLEMSNTALFFLYEGGGASGLITILDKTNDGSGGTANIAYRCMPQGSFVGLADDGGELFGGPPNFTGNFSWGACCTDGGVINGMGCGDSFIINPTFGSGINTISIVSGTPGAPVYLNLPSLECPIIINCGGSTCCDNAIEFEGVSENAKCADTNDGSITIDTECTGGPIFSWSNGATTQNLNGLAPGLYSVTITDVGGCTATASYTIGVENNDPTPSITGAAFFCTGDDAVLGVNGTYTAYAWSNGTTGPSISVNTPGEYTVTVTNAAGCTGTATTIIEENTPPDVNIAGPLEFCENEEVILDAGEGFDNYIWSDGSFTQMITISEPGSYIVTVFGNGCTDTDEIIVVENPLPQPGIIGQEVLCEGYTAVLETAEAHTFYSWSNGATAQSISVNTGGLYTLTVTDNAGCTGTDDFYIIQGQSDTIDIQQTSCNPLDTGTFYTPYTNVQGCPSLKIQTIAFASKDSVVHLSNSCFPQDTGIFSNTFTNRFGCDSLDIRIVRLLPQNITLLQERSCTPQDTGLFSTIYPNQYGCDSLVTRIVRLSPSDTTHIQKRDCNPANTGTREFRLKNRFGCDSLVVIRTIFASSDTTLVTLKSCDPLLAGTKETRYINDQGCDSLVITETYLIKGDTSILEDFTCNKSLVGVSKTLLTNINGCDSLVIRNTMLTPGDTTVFQSFSCLASDTGTVVKLLSNRFGCDSLVVNQTFLLSGSQCTMQAVIMADTIGCGEQTGRLRLTLPEGAPPYTYQWSSLQGGAGQGIIMESGTTTEIFSLLPGAYTYTITDSKGLVAILSATLFKVMPITASINILKEYNGFQVSCAGASDGHFRLDDIQGGIAPYLTQWSNGSSLPEQSGMKSGWYQVRILSAYGCIFTDSIELKEPLPLQFSIETAQPDCFTNGKGSIQIINPEGGVKPHQYSINQQSASANREFKELGAGTYNLGIIDANGCRTEAQTDISAYTPATVQLGKDTIIQQGIAVRLVYTLNEGSAPMDTIFWEGIECENCPEVTVAPDYNTLYKVVIIDSLGCRSEDDILITIQQDETVTIPNIFAPNSSGGNKSFTLYGSKNLVLIESMTIFDRWGNKVFEARNFPPNDATYGWDGGFGTEIPVPGVYIYSCTVQFSSGRRITITGDVTLF